MRPEKEIPTHVYVMQIGDRSKLGISADPAKRKRQLEQASGVDVVLRSSRLFSSRASAKFVEKTLHRRFNRWRLHGEWFSVRADLLIAAMKEAFDPGLKDYHPIDFFL